MQLSYQATLAISELVQNIYSKKNAPPQYIRRFYKKNGDKASLVSIFF